MAITDIRNISPAITPSLSIAIADHCLSLPDDQTLLTHLYFGADVVTQQDCLSIQTNLAVLDKNQFSQFWMTDQKVDQQQYKHIHFAQSTDMLFGHVQLPLAGKISFDELTTLAYQEIFECLQMTNCSHLLRTWNFFPNITGHDATSQNMNRYELFCSGRFRALQSCQMETSNYPAATVIGNQAENLQIYFFASSTSGIAVENPRQTSAYLYPIENEQSQPLFSRGLLKTWGHRTHFYVSGTASIVGHKTRHIDNVCAQLNESINNVETLVAHANDQYQTHLNAQDDLLYMKIYVRNEKDVAHIKKVLAARLSSNTPRVLLLGDMCRDDLLVEIEAFYQS